MCGSCTEKCIYATREDAVKAVLDDINKGKEEERTYKPGDCFLIKNTGDGSLAGKYMLIQHGQFDALLDLLGNYTVYGLFCPENLAKVTINELRNHIGDTAHEWEFELIEDSEDEK